VELELLAPEPDFVYRAASVAEPFERGVAQRHSLAEIAADMGFELRAGWLAAVVDPSAGRAATRTGEEVEFDVLVGITPV
jgi:hypothetical protein